MTTNQRVTIGTVIGTALLAAVGVWAIAWVGADAALKPDPPRDSPFLAPYAFAVEDIEFPARDGAPLVGWFIAAAPPPGEDPLLRPAPAIILVHAYGGTRDAMLPGADMLSRAGFHVLIFDQRGTGHSGGTNVTFGAREPLDVVGALDLLTKRPGVDAARIGVMGVGMGGSVAIMAAAQDPRIRAVAAEAPYASFDASLGDVLSAVGLPGLLRPLAKRILLSRIGGSPEDRAPLDAAARLGDRPVMLIADTEVSTVGTEAIYAAVAGPKELWLAAGTMLGSEVRQQYPADYGVRVLAFWRRAFEGPAAALAAPVGTSR